MYWHGLLTFPSIYGWSTHENNVYSYHISAETNFQPRSNIYDYNLDESAVTLHSCIPFYQSNQLPTFAVKGISTSLICMQV